LNINEPLYTFTRTSGIRVRALLFLTLSPSQARFTKSFFGTRSIWRADRASASFVFLWRVRPTLNVPRYP